jgi:hypothetical protein
VAVGPAAPEFSTWRKSSRFHIAFIDHAFVRFLLAFDAILLFATVFWKRSDDLIFAVRPPMEKATAETYVLSGKKFGCHVNSD